MTADATATGPLVLTGPGRDWIRARLQRTNERLAQIDRELVNERTDELIAEHRTLTEQAEDLQRLLRDAVAPADVVDDPTVVELGDEVEVEFPDGSRESFLIVHPAEAPMDDHRTSADSPLARAVLGRRPGERVTVTAPVGVYSCAIVRRERIDGDGHGPRSAT